MEDGVSEAERESLGKLTGPETGGGRKESAGATPARAPRPPAEPPRTGPLTRTEEMLHRELLKESRQFVREKLPEMFPAARRQVAEEPEPARAQMDAGGGPGGLAGIGTFALEVLSYPARRLGPVAVTGMGLAGVLLLTALLVVVLVRMLTRT